MRPRVGPFAPGRACRWRRIPGLHGMTNSRARRAAPANDTKTACSPGGGTGLHRTQPGPRSLSSSSLPGQPSETRNRQGAPRAPRAPHWPRTHHQRNGASFVSPPPFRVANPLLNVRVQTASKGRSTRQGDWKRAPRARVCRRTGGGDTIAGMELSDGGSLNLRERDTLMAVLRPLKMLEELVRWGFAQSPPLDIKDVVVQDEYSHDVVLHWHGGRYLVF